jgi:transposase
MNILKAVFNTIQNTLFPWIEEPLGPLTEKEKQFVEVVSLMNLPEHMKAYNWKGIGRKKKDRLCLLKAFIVKPLYNIDSTKLLIDLLKGDKTLRRLCGWETKGAVPSEATFSRAFTEFSKGKLLQKIHEAMVKTYCGPKIVGHVSRDSTEIEAREKPVKKEKKKASPKRKQGRPKKGEETGPKELKRLDIQPGRTLEENLKDLPVQCNVGSKLDSKGHKHSWTGYKLHLDCIDGDIPVSAVLTSASLHDSQAAIPLAQMTAERVTSLYDLMDSAYDAHQIHEFSRSMGHVPIIDHNPRRGVKREMAPAEKRRYCERSTAERVNSNLKDNYGGRKIRVKGHEKVMTHLMCGIIIITATQLFRLLI